MRADALLTAATLGLTGGTFRYLENQKISIVPITGCISFGFSMALLGTAVLRYRGARELERYQVHTAPPPAAGASNRVAPAEKHILGAGSLPDLPPAFAALDRAQSGGSASARTAGPETAVALHALADGADGAPLKRHMDVLDQVLRLKNRGAAGGYNAYTRSALLLRHAAAPAAACDVPCAAWTICVRRATGCVGNAMSRSTVQYKCQHMQWIAPAEQARAVQRRWPRAEPGCQVRGLCQRATCAPLCSPGSLQKTLPWQRRINFQAQQCGAGLLKQTTAARVVCCAKLTANDAVSSKATCRSIQGIE